MENIPRDVLNYIVFQYIRDADNFRNLSLSCKLFAEICRKNKYRSEIHNDIIGIYTYYASKSIIYKSVNFTLMVCLFYYDKKLHTVKLNLYTHGMDHLFVDMLRLEYDKLIYDYEWGKDYCDYPYNDGCFIKHKYSIACVSNHVGIYYNFESPSFPVSGIMSQMPYIKNINIKFALQHENIGTLSYNNGFIKLTR